MKYCSTCGARVTLTVPAGDNRERYVCVDCGDIHYQNPNVVVGTIPVHIDDNGVPSILLCLRSIEPRHGYWTLPAGFLENGETSTTGALRETEEESCAAIENLQLFRVFNVAQVNQIHMFFNADLPKAEFSPTPESSEVKLFGFDQIPWEELAFPTVHKALKDYIEHWPNQAFSIAMVDIDNRYWRRMHKHDA